MNEPIREELVDAVVKVLRTGTGVVILETLTEDEIRAVHERATAENEGED